MVVVLVLATLDVDVGPEAREQFDGGVRGVDVDVIDELQCGEIFGTEFLRNIGRPSPLPTCGSPVRETTRRSPCCLAN